MNDYKITYEQRKNTIIDLLEKARSFSEKNGQRKNEEIYRSLTNSIRNGEFSIVVVGEFSAGKSTFLNALMGERILPSYTDETTATVNFLRHKDCSNEGEVGRVYYSNGNEESLKKLELDTIMRYVSTRSDLNVTGDVEHLDLFIESRFLEGNVTLVDSPGLNGTADGHRDITEEQIAKSSASIFMFRAEQPGSRSDFEFLKQLKDKVNTVIFVLNKIDEIKSSEKETVESVIETLKANYKKRFPEETTIPEIWGISAYQALVARSNQKLDYRDRNDFSNEEKLNYLSASRMVEFEQRLWKFLTQGEKARKQLLEPTLRIQNLMNSDLKSLNSELEILKSKNDTNEVMEKINALKKQIEEMQKAQGELIHSIEAELKVLERDLRESVNKKVETNKNREIKKVTSWNDISELEEYEQNLNKKIQKGFAKLLEDIQEEFNIGLLEIVSTKYSLLAQEINEKFELSNFNISLDLKYQLTESGFEMGIENYEKEIKDLEASIQEVYLRIDDSETNKIKRLHLERDKENLEEQLERSKFTRKAFEQNLTPPSVKRYSLTEMRESQRTGALIILKNLLIGKKEIQVTVNKTDDTDLQEWKERVKSIKEQYESDKNSYEKRLNELRLNGESSAVIDAQHKQYLRRLNELERKKDEKREAFKEEYMKRNEGLIRKKKIAIEEYFDECSEAYRKEMTRVIKNNKKSLVDIIKTLITNELERGLKERQNELETLNSKLSSSKQEKQKCIEEMQLKAEEMKEIISHAIEISSELESQDVDEIKQVQLD